MSFAIKLLPASVAVVLLLGGCGAPAPTSTSAPTPTKAPAAAATATKAPTPTPPLVKLTFTQASEGIAYGAAYMARGRYYKEENIDVDYVIPGSGAKALAAVIGGSAQFAVGAFGDVLNANIGGQPMVSLAATQNEYGSNIVISKEVAQRLGITYASSEEAKIKALKGLRIGITSPGSGTDQLARYLLRRYNIDPERDAELASVGIAGMVSGLAAKQIDVFVASSPTSDQAVARGDAIWLFKMAAGDIKELSPFTYLTLNARKDYVVNNPDVVKRVVRAIVKGTKLLKENPNEAKLIMSSFFKDLDPAVFDEAWKTNLPSFGDPAITKAGFEANIKFQKVLGTDTPLTYEQVVISNFVEDAKREVGFR